MTKDIHAERIAQNGFRQSSSQFSQQQSQTTTQNQSGYAPGTPNHPDEFFTSAVSVQHKRNDYETSSYKSSSRQQNHQETSSYESYGYQEEDPQYRKVVWPANYQVYQSELAPADPLNAHTPVIDANIDKPLSWIHSVANSHERVESKEKNYEMEIQKRTWDVHLANNRLSRSRSKSILDRAKCYERSAANASTSLPGSRRGSFSKRVRSPSMNGRISRNQSDNYWHSAVEGSDSRPQSRTDFDSRKWSSVGRLDTSDWEMKIQNAGKANYLLRGPQKIQYDRNLPYKQESAHDQSRHHQKRSTSQKNQSSLNQINQSCSKEEIIEQWMRQSSSSDQKRTTNTAKNSSEAVAQSAAPSADFHGGQDGLRKQGDEEELRQFAYDVAESLVNTLEQNQLGPSSQQPQVRRESNGSSSVKSFHTATSTTNTMHQQRSFEQNQTKATHGESQGVFRAIPAQANLDAPEGNWENWREIAEQRRQEERKKGAQREQQKKMQTKGRTQQQQQNIQQTVHQQQFHEVKQEQFLQEQQSIKEKQIQAIHERQKGGIANETVSTRQQEAKLEQRPMASAEANPPGVPPKSLKEKKYMVQQQREHEQLMTHQQRWTQGQQKSSNVEQNRLTEQTRLEEQRRMDEQKRTMEEHRRIEEVKRIEEQRRIEELKRQEEQRTLHEHRRMEEKRRIEEQRRIEEVKRQEEQRTLEEHRRMEEKRRIEEQRRLEATRFQEELHVLDQRKMEQQRQQEHLASERDLVAQQQKRRFVEERRRYEEVQQSHQQVLHNDEMHRAQQSQMSSDSKHVRRAPKAKLQKAQSFNQEDMESSLLRADQFANIKTGMVNEKRNFWLRSSSNERLDSPQWHQSPGPRRRWIGEKDWMRQQALRSMDDTGRAESSMAQANDFGNVRQVVSDWTNIAKSRSSTAILQDDHLSRSRPGSSLSRPIPAWLREDQAATEGSTSLTKDIHTNQVRETVDKWPSKSREGSQQPNSGRSTPAPTKHIGQSFADNRIAKDGKLAFKQDEVLMTSNQTSSSSVANKSVGGCSLEPPLKLVNVAVMKANNGENEKMTFSQTAQQQMKGFSQYSSSTLNTTKTKVTNEQHQHQNESRITASTTRDDQISKQTESSKSKESAVKEFFFEPANKKTPPLIPFSKKDAPNRNGPIHYQAPTTPAQSKSINNTANSVQVSNQSNTRAFGSKAGAMLPSEDPKVRSTPPHEPSHFALKTSNVFPATPSKSAPTPPKITPTPPKITPTPPHVAPMATQGTPTPPRPTPMSPHAALRSPHVAPAVPTPTQEPKQESPQKVEEVDSRRFTSKETKATFGPSPPKIPFSKGKGTVVDHSQKKPPMPAPRIPSPDRKVQPMPKPKSTPVLPLANATRPTDTGLPMPVAQSWFDPNREGTEASEVSSTSSFGNFERIGSPAGAPNKTPIPVLAGWFDEEGRKSKPESPQMASSGPIPIPPPPPPPEMRKKNSKRVDFEEPPPFSPPPGSEVSSLNIEEMADQGHDLEDQQSVRGNVKGNIAMFQEGKIAHQRDHSLEKEDWKESMRGCVTQSRRAFAQPSMSTEKEDGERLMRQKELEEISKARSQANWDDVEQLGGHEDRKESRTQELQAIAEMRSKRAADAWDAERSSEKMLEAARDQRAQELQEIASMRSQNHWDDVNAEVRAKAEKSHVIQEQKQMEGGAAGIPVPPPAPPSMGHSSRDPAKHSSELDIDDMISTFQDVAASWQMRGNEPPLTQNPQSQQREGPSRRIGNLFKHNPRENPAGGSSVPPPPARQSSKDYMMDINQNGP